MGEGWCRAQWGLLGLLPKEGKEDSKPIKGSLVDRWQMCKDNAREPAGNKVTPVGVGLDDVREGSRTQDTSVFWMRGPWVSRWVVSDSLQPHGL